MLLSSSWLVAVEFCHTVLAAGRGLWVSHNHDCSYRANDALLVMLTKCIMMGGLRPRYVLQLGRRFRPFANGCQPGTIRPPTCLPLRGWDCRTSGSVQGGSHMARHRCEALMGLDDLDKTTSEELLKEQAGAFFACFLFPSMCGLNRAPIEG